MNTGDNEQGLRRIMDMIRMGSLVLLGLHYYFTCYAAFEAWGLRSKLTDRILLNIGHTGFFDRPVMAKGIILALLAVALLGVRGKKMEKLRQRTVVAYILTGATIYFASVLCLLIPGDDSIVAVLYMAATSLGYLLFLSGATLLSRVIRQKLSKDVFNTANEWFPQEERLITNEFSFNLPMCYRAAKGWRDSYLNCINPRRGVLICGSPGSGKSFHILENFLRIQIRKGYSQFTYDMKFPELTTLVYNYYLKHRKDYPKPPRFCTINFSLPEYSHQCNPLHPAYMLDQIDAIEASRTILLSINKSWAQRQGEFFVESPMNLLAAVIWYLRKYRNGEFCTLPHAIEMLQLPYDELFTILRTEEDILILLNPFISAYENDVMETLDNQVSSVKIPLGRLASPMLYWVMSGNDFTLDINNPNDPKLFCLGNDPTKAEALAPIMSLYADRMNKIINVQGRMKCATNYDEFASLRAASVQTVISQGRSNLIACVIAIQDISQLRKVYSRDEADAIWNMTGNIISGQVAGDSARQLAERFPKTLQDKNSLSINRTDVSVSKAKQLEFAVTASLISNLSSGEFVGVVADNPDQPIELKAFHAKVVNDLAAITREKKQFVPLPVIKKVDAGTIQRNFLQIKTDIEDLKISELERINSDPSLARLIVTKA
ncbi:YWFCY domain-containing protein [Puia sp. P3]|uniref:YWFCY domain-containing protein n=1 Tax=Puia sp. P3 TaxID=3423952 RepID=UPI003D679CE5